MHVGNMNWWECRGFYGGNHFHVCFFSVCIDVWVQARQYIDSL